MNINNDSFICSSSFDIDEKPITPEDVRQLCGRDDPCILEVGANNGYAGLQFCKLMPKARLYAFEPDPRAIKKWKHVMRETDAQLFEIAIGAYDGTVTFHQSGGKVNDIHTDWDMSGSIKKPVEHCRLHPKILFENQIQVPIKKLDTWSSEEMVHTVDFIWADLQGAELDMIEGASLLLKNTRYIYLEYCEVELYENQPSLQALSDALPEHAISRIWRNDVLFSLN